MPPRKRKAEEKLESVVPFTHFAFLRGVNVGSIHRVTMSSIKTLIAELAFISRSATYLQSGNIALAFDGAAEDQANMIRLRQALPVQAVILRRDSLQRLTTTAGLATLAALPDDFDQSKLLVQLFNRKLKQTERDAVLTLFAQDEHHGCFLVMNDANVEGDIDAAALWCPNGISKSPWFKVKWNKIMPDVECTARNWRTLKATLALA